LQNRKNYGRLVILYGGRSPRDLLYRKELATWARNRETQVLVTVEEATWKCGQAVRSYDPCISCATHFLK
jgi:Ni,Fe-hydrogenase I large subunit